jgi:hypothetical protein
VHHIRYINHIKKSPEFQLPLYFLSMLLKIKIIFVQYDIFFIEILPIEQIVLIWIVYFAKMPFVQVAQSHPTVI